MGNAHVRTELQYVHGRIGLKFSRGDITAASGGGHTALEATTVRSCAADHAAYTTENDADDTDLGCFFVKVTAPSVDDHANVTEIESEINRLETLLQKDFGVGVVKGKFEPRVFFMPIR